MPGGRFAVGAPKLSRASVGLALSRASVGLPKLSHASVAEAGPCVASVAGARSASRRGAPYSQVAGASFAFSGRGAGGRAE